MRLAQRFLFAAIGLSVLTLNGCTCSRNQPAPESETSAQATPDPNKAPDYSGITVARVLTTDMTPGKGAVAKENSTITGHYTMWVYAPKELGNKGKRISGTEEGKPFSFTVGKGDVVKGFEQGVIGMKEGGKRSMVIPIELGYGPEGTKEVPANSILLVEFELVKVQ